MAFMTPYYTREDFALIDAMPFGDSEPIPVDCVTSDQEVLETIKGKVWARLWAPGYLDCTDWLGPFETMQEAKDAIVAAFDVCPYCGAGLSDEGNGTPDEAGCDCAEHETGDIDHG